MQSPGHFNSANRSVAVAARRLAELRAHRECTGKLDVILDHGVVVPQTSCWRSKACNQRFDLRRDLRFMNIHKRIVIKKEFAAEPLSARAELDLIRPQSVWRKRHHQARLGTLNRFSNRAQLGFIGNFLKCGSICKR